MKALVLLLVTVCATAAIAQPVYRWTDAEGRVHFGDRPPEGIEARTVDIAPPPPSSGTSPAGAASATVPPAQGTNGAQRQPLSIVMYATADCGYCAHARRYFAQRGIGFREKDIDRYAQAKAEWKRLGGTGVPLFVINGDVSRGFNADSMSRTLARLGW